MKSLLVVVPRSVDLWSGKVPCVARRLEKSQESRKVVDRMLSMGQQEMSI